MARIDLPNGAWADLRESIDDAPRRLVRPVTAAEAAVAALPMFDTIRAASDMDDEQKADVARKYLPEATPLMEALAVAQILAVVTAWSLSDSVDEETIDNMASSVFVALSAEVGARCAAAAQVTAAELANPTPALDPLSA